METMFIFIIIITAHEQMTGNSGVLNGMTDSETCGFMSYSTQNRLFRRRLPKPISWLGMEKLNLTQQKHAFTNQNKCSATQNKLKN